MWSNQSKLVLFWCTVCTYGCTKAIYRRPIAKLCHSVSVICPNLVSGWKFSSFWFDYYVSVTVLFNMIHFRKHSFTVCFSVFACLCEAWASEAIITVKKTRSHLSWNKGYKICLFFCINLISLLYFIALTFTPYLLILNPLNPFRGFAIFYRLMKINYIFC